MSSQSEDTYIIRRRLCVSRHFLITGRHRGKTERKIDPARAKVKDGNQPKERKKRKEKHSSGAEQDIATQERGRK